MLAIQIIPEINVTRIWEAYVFDVGGATHTQTDVPFMPPHTTGNRLRSF